METTRDNDTEIPPQRSKLKCHQKVEKLIREKVQQGTEKRPFYIVNLDDVVHKHKQWTELMPRVKPFYAVKCNNAGKILRLLATLGTGFDCASLSEIQQVLDIGVEPSRIIFAHPCKDKWEVKPAWDLGIRLMTFDNEDELVKIKSLVPEARLVLRVLPQVTMSAFAFGKKFGCAFDQCADLLGRAKDMGLNVVGLSFHVGSLCLDSFCYQHTLSLCRKLFDFAKTVGFNFNFLDIGGGFPGFEDRRNPKFADMAKGINCSLEKHFPVEDSIDIVAEPGRYFVESAYTLALRVIAKRIQRPAAHMESNATKKSLEESTMYYVNDGIHGAFIMKVMFFKQNVDFCTFKEEATPVYQCSVWGSTLNPHDCLAESTHLPELNTGDWFYVPNMGAYTTVTATSFNGMPSPNFYWIGTDDNTRDFVSEGVNGES